MVFKFHRAGLAEEKLPSLRDETGSGSRLFLILTAEAPGTPR
jgi:hypothetical protein